MPNGGQNARNDSDDDGHCHRHRQVKLAKTGHKIDFSFGFVVYFSVLHCTLFVSSVETIATEANAEHNFDWRKKSKSSMHLRLVWCMLLHRQHHAELDGLIGTRPWTWLSIGHYEISEISSASSCYFMAIAMFIEQ